MGAKEWYVFCLCSQWFDLTSVCRAQCAEESDNESPLFLLSAKRSAKQSLEEGVRRGERRRRVSFAQGTKY